MAGVPGRESPGIGKVNRVCAFQRAFGPEGIDRMRL